jgi:hypothetical protein
MPPAISLIENHYQGGIELYPFIGRDRTISLHWEGLNFIPPLSYNFG